MLTKKNKYRPLHKQFIKLNENLDNKKKIFKFKKQKWQFFIQNYKRKLSRHNKFKLQNPTIYTVSQFSNKKNSYKKRYLQNLHNLKLFKLFYGGLKNKSLKKKLKVILKNTKNYNELLKLELIILEEFEKKLDTVLYRAKFGLSMRNSKQLISHGKIFVNNKKVTSCSYKLKHNDLVSIDTKYHFLIKNNIRNLNVWPLPPKHLIINYKTLQIMFTNFKNNSITHMNYNLNLEKLINNISLQ